MVVTVLLKKVSSSILAALLTSQSAFAGAATGHGASACAPSLAMSAQEVDSLYQFNANLSWLDGKYGRPNFSASLVSIIDAKISKKEKLANVSPFYFERIGNLVEQAKLRDLIAKTIGLENQAWKNFDYHMRNITLHRSTSGNLLNPFSSVAVRLIKTIEQKRPSANGKSEFTEAILATAQMFDYLQKWRVLNGEILDAEVEATSKTVAVIAIGAVGLGVLYSTLIVAGPIVGGSGVAMGSLASNAVWAARLAKVGEILAGGGVGLVGAPAARTSIDSYHTVTEAWKQSLNNHSSYACEITKSVEHWKEVAGQNTLSAAILGTTMGVGGGAFTLSGAGAKVLLRVTGAGVLTAQGYSVGQMGYKAYQSVLHYNLAEEALRMGNVERSRQLTEKARDLAQEAGDKALETIIIGVLTNHVVHHYKHALHDGASAIRKLYAASADTIPTAGLAIKDIVDSVL
jgi:hypothetical protein